MLIVLALLGLVVIVGTTVAVVLRARGADDIGRVKFYEGQDEDDDARR